MGKQKQSIFEMDVDELKKCCVGLGLPKYIADQVLDWVYKKHQLSIDKMKNISKKKSGYFS